MVRPPVTKVTAALFLTLALALAAVPSQAAGFSPERGFPPERSISWEQLATRLFGWFLKSSACIDPNGRCVAAPAPPEHVTTLCFDSCAGIDPNGHQ